MLSRIGAKKGGCWEDDCSNARDNDGKELRFYVLDIGSAQQCPKAVAEESELSTRVAFAGSGSLRSGGGKGPGSPGSEFPFKAELRLPVRPRPAGG